MGQRKMSHYRAHLGCWISSCYGPFSLGAHFETYEPFSSLMFQFIFELQWTADTESVDTGARLYLFSWLWPTSHTEKGTEYFKNSCWQNLKLGTHIEVVSFEFVQWTRIVFSITLECVDASPPCHMRRWTDTVSRTCSLLEQAAGFCERDNEPSDWGVRSSGMCGCVVQSVAVNLWKHHIPFNHWEPYTQMAQHHITDNPKPPKQYKNLKSQNIHVPYNLQNLLTSWQTIYFSMTMLNGVS
jgi:hypothetical protein